MRHEGPHCQAAAAGDPRPQPGVEGGSTEATSAGAEKFSSLPPRECARRAAAAAAGRPRPGAPLARSAPSSARAGRRSQRAPRAHSAPSSAVCPRAQLAPHNTMAWPPRTCRLVMEGEKRREAGIPLPLPPRLGVVHAHWPPRRQQRHYPPSLPDRPRKRCRRPCCLRR